MQLQAEFLWKYNLERTDFLKKGQRFATERFGMSLLILLELLLRTIALFCKNE